MKVGKILEKACLGLGYTGLAVYGTTQLYRLYDFVKTKLREHRGKCWQKGYDDGVEAMQIRIDELKRENAKLYKEALQRSEAAE